MASVAVVAAILLCIGGMCLVIRNGLGKMDI